MSSPDSSNEFSHLPTVDETERDAAGLWQRHRRTPGAGEATPPPKAKAEPQPRPQPVAPPAPPRDAEAWQSLLEMEDDEAQVMEHQRRVAAARKAAAAPPAAEAQPTVPRKRTVIRAPGKREEEVVAAPSPPAAESTPRVDAGALKAHASTPAMEDRQPAVREPAKARKKVEPEVKAPAETREESLSGDEGEGSKAKKRDAAADDEKTPADAEAKEGKEAPKGGVKIETEGTPKSPWRHRWEKIGGQALGLSVLLHLVVLAGAAVYVVGRAMETQVDFLPGGGTSQGQAASEALQNKIQQKKNPWLKKSMPIRRLATLNKAAEFNLPDAPDSFELPDAGSTLLKSKLGAGMGLAGAGGGFGNGMGLGSRSGMVFQPFTMFGRQINARKMALVLDVSSSMAPHLPRVIEEVDKVAKDSVVVLFVGCGLEPPPPKGLDGEEIYRTSGQEFEKFWRLQGGTLEEGRKFKINPKDPIPMEEIFRMLARRPQTYFVHGVGLSYTWVALLCNEVRSADALYWFSDFQDRVEFKQLSIVRDNLLNRKQKLYIHAYQRGSSFDLVVSQLVQPTNGDVIEVQE